MCLVDCMGLSPVVARETDLGLAARSMKHDSGKFTLHDNIYMIISASREDVEDSWKFGKKEMTDDAYISCGTWEHTLCMHMRMHGCR